MSLQTWLWFCATEAVLSLTPGPAVLLVISLSLTRGAAAGIVGSLGILSANIAYFALSATSLGAVLVTSYRLFLAIKWIGATYLICVGIRMIFASDRPGQPSQSMTPRSIGRSFSIAVLTQGANPKALIFFTAILPQFIDARGRVPFQIAVLGTSSVAIEFLVLALYVVTCRTARGWVDEGRLASPLQRVGGAVLIGAGARLAANYRG